MGAWMQDDSEKVNENESTAAAFPFGLVAVCCCLDAVLYGGSHQLHWTHRLT